MKPATATANRPATRKNRNSKLYITKNTGLRPVFFYMWHEDAILCLHESEIYY